jgi:SAM-dependent methyltransferase
LDLIESALNEKTPSRHPWELARSKVVMDIIEDHLPQLSEVGTEVLDIGCGDSWLIEQIAKDYSQAHLTAVDTAFSKELLEAYRKKFVTDQFHFDTDLSRALQGIEKVDLVLLLDVIEHIEDEIQFLRNLIKKQEAVTNDTLFLITVPAFQSLFSAHDEFLGHYRRYNRKILTNRLESSGLEVIKTGYFFSSLVPPRSFIKFLEVSRLKSKKVKGIGDHQKSSIDTLVERTLYLDYKVGKSLRNLGIHLPGLSTFALARPQKA